MEIKKKSEDMLFLENCFKELKDKQATKENLNKIQRILKRTFDLNFHIDVIDNDTNQFFGMNIYPSRNTIDNIVSSILEKGRPSNDVSKIWQENSDWYLEIDSLLLYDNNLNANPSEIAAVLLHEIGHVVHSNTIPQRVKKVLKYEYFNLKFSVKKLCENYRIRKLFDLSVIEACNSKNYHYVNTNVERTADKFVINMGYADELNNFITKLISTQGNRLVNRTEAEMDTDIRAIVNWSVDNISELEYRKRKLRNSLQTELLRSPSKYVKEVLESIKRSFFANDDSTYQSALSEQYLITDCKQIVQESFLELFDNIGKVKKISQSDVDILSVQIEKIENNDDKIYALDLIYDKLDLVNTALEYIDKGKLDKVAQSKQTITGFKNQLEKLRQTVLNTQVKDKQYGVFIKYPKGYEG